MHTHHIQFFTATCYHWLPLLSNNFSKQIIIDSMDYLVAKKRTRIFGFIIMPNHIHLIWKLGDNEAKGTVQRDFLKFTAQQIKFYLIKTSPNLLERCAVHLKDRKYQIWQRNALSVDLWSRETVEQKLDYIHANPVSGKWNLANEFTDYMYSSARFYEDNESEFKFLRHYMECFNG
jgi:putative transposase